MKQKKVTWRFVVLTSISILLTGVLIMSTVAGANTISASVDTESKTVTVTGNLSIGPDKYVTVRVTDPTGNIDNVNQLLTGDDGKISYQYVINNANSGLYTVECSSAALNSPVKTSFNFDAAEGLVGDVNGDGKVNSVDFGYMRMYLLGMIKDFPVDDDLRAGDLNGDDRINSIDFGYFRSYLLGMIKEFPKK